MMLDKLIKNGHHLPIKLRSGDPGGLECHQLIFPIIVNGGLSLDSNQYMVPMNPPNHTYRWIDTSITPWICFVILCCVLIVNTFFYRYGKNIFRYTITFCDIVDNQQLIQRWTFDV